jgi:hypothetical protein
MGTPGDPRQRLPIVKCVESRCNEEEKLEHDVPFWRVRRFLSITAFAGACAAVMRIAAIFVPDFASLRTKLMLSARVPVIRMHDMRHTSRRLLCPEMDLYSHAMPEMFIEAAEVIDAPEPIAEDKAAAVGE